jgi:hypothetical protein
MAYPIEIRLANKNGWHTPDEAKKYYGRYSRDGITVHWWNTPTAVKDSDHDNIVNYILGKAIKGTGSVNYVLSNNKITMLVNPDNVAWASQAGNPTTISVEFSPQLNAEGYKKAGWLINELFNPVNGRYKKAPRLWKHSDFFTTQCPGTLDLNRMLAEANKWATGGYNPAPLPPPPAPAPVPVTKNKDFILWKDGGAYVANKQPTNLYDMTNVTSWPDTIPVVKSFNKGDIIDIAGSFYNVGLKREYYITKFSFDNKRATGFNPVDLDIYVPPRPVPKPPEPSPTDPTDPTPVEPTDPPAPTPDPPEDVPVWFIKLVKDFIVWISDKLRLTK